MSSMARYERVRLSSSQSQSVPPACFKEDVADMVFEQVAHEDNDTTASTPAIPHSPPPSFRSRTSSRRESQDEQNDGDRDLNDAFDAPSDSEDEHDDDSRSQRRLLSRHNSDLNPPAADSTESDHGDIPNAVQRRVTEIPTFTPTNTSGRVYGGGNAADGVWANISAKPRPGEDMEEKPPSYEQAAADATPPYWETTVMSPYSYSGNPDDVFVDGLLVGSLFSFIWNALISMSFQLIGFLLTYLLHTTHAAKHGSRAGLGITLVQYGFQMRYAASKGSSDSMPRLDDIPEDPNSHDFDPDSVMSGSPAHGLAGLSTSDWLSYVLMIVGWFILIRAVTDFLRARRQEALVRSSPDRGLGTAIVAEGERPENSV